MMENRPKIHLVGNAHLDPVWLWQWQEGFAEIKATFRSALDRMNEFPDFTFTSACAAYYQWVEENDPEMFEEIRARVAEGRWVIAGGWWIQPDCNLPSGESFARHGLYSQRYFLEKFGTTAKVGYNVDSFGHNAMLPQILKKSGMDCYVFMRPGSHENAEIPAPLFWWQSPDGSRVLTYRICGEYCTGPGEDGLKQLTDKIDALGKIAEDKKYPVMCFYGVGNHGGGPTIASLKVINRLRKEPAGKQIVMSSPNDYFKEAREIDGLPVWSDDLQHHASGCYSTTHEIKAGNRRAENLLTAAEKFQTAAHRMRGLPYQGEELHKAWEDVLFNQFHDIMGGCCIRDAVKDAVVFHGEALTIGARALNAAVQKISWSVDTSAGAPVTRSKEKDGRLWEKGDMGTPVVVFNPLSWEAEVPVRINQRISAAADNEGHPIAVQTVRGPQTNGGDKWNSLFTAKVPALGYRLYWIYLTKESTALPEGLLLAEEHALENDFLRIEIDPHTGYIARLYDKTAGREVLSGMGARPLVIDYAHCDTWAHTYFSFRDVVARFTDATIRLIESGPVRAVLRVENRNNASTLRQDFILYRGRPEVEVAVRLDWHEKHKLLKLSFPVDVDAPKATYEIPYGHLERPVNGEEEPGQQWVDVGGGDGGYGLSLLNDAKYSFDVGGNDLRMTIANGSIYADHFADYNGAHNRDELCDYMDQGVQEFRYALLPHAGSWREAETYRRAHELNTAFPHVMETYHKGPLAPVYGCIAVEAENVAATVLKEAEEPGACVLRCCETAGRQAETTIRLPFLGREWRAHFGPSEIKTFVIPDDPEKPVRETNLTELL